MRELMIAFGLNNAKPAMPMMMAMFAFPAKAE